MESPRVPQGKIKRHGNATVKTFAVVNSDRALLSLLGLGVVMRLLSLYVTSP